MRFSDGVTRRRFVQGLAGAIGALSLGIRFGVEDSAFVTERIRLREGPTIEEIRARIDEVKPVGIGLADLRQESDVFVATFEGMGRRETVTLSGFDDVDARFPRPSYPDYVTPLITGEVQSSFSG